MGDLEPYSTTTSPGLAASHNSKPGTTINTQPVGAENRTAKKRARKRRKEARKRRGKEKKKYLHHYIYSRGADKGNTFLIRSSTGLSGCLHRSTLWCNPIGSAMTINP